MDKRIIIYIDEEEESMKATKVRSSFIDSVGYDSDIKDLRIRMLNDSEYIYHDVPKEILEGLLSAKSKGIYFRQNIMTRYKCEHLKKI